MVETQRSGVALLFAACVLLLTTQGVGAAEGHSRKLLQQWGNNWGNNWGSRPQGWGQQWGGGQKMGGPRPGLGGRDQGPSPSNSGTQVGSQAASIANRNKGDINSLSPLIAPAQGLRGRPAQVIAPPSSGPGAQLVQNLRRRGEARASAAALAQSFGSNSDAAATAVASAATSSSGGEASAVAAAVAQTTVSHPNIAPSLLAKSADLAVTRGQTSAFAATMADAFGVAKRGSYVPQFTRSVADAISQGGAPARLTYGEAIAKAIAGGGDSQAAVAEATATAFCEGGSTAQSWASAFAVALSKDSKGCLVLNEAKAMAQAKCGNGVAETISKAEATSLVLGFCGLADLIPGFNFSGGNSGSNSNSWGR